MTTITKIFNFSLVLCLCLGFALNVSAQSISKHNLTKGATLKSTSESAKFAKATAAKKRLSTTQIEKAVNATSSARTMQDPNGNGGMNTNAMWDIQFQFDHETAVPSPGPAGFAGVFYVSALNEIWASDFNSDTLVRFNTSGNYLGFLRITGLPTTGTGVGIRAATTDGINIYAANNTNTVYKLTYPGTGTTVTAISALTTPAAVGAVRWLSYDGSGTPGLWVGNFGTAISKITIPATPGAATVIGTPIAAATHGLTAMYGVVYDGTSSGGPYFWAFDQAQGASAAVVVQLNATTGAQTGVTHDVDADLGALGGSAGGINIATIPGYNFPTLLCLEQGVGIIGYELNYVFQSTTNAKADSLDPSNGLTWWPYVQNGPVSFVGKIKNMGNQPLNGVVETVDLVEESTATPLASYSSSPTNLAAGASYTFTVGPHTAADTGLYVAYGNVTYPGDIDPTDDNMNAIYVVSDSTFARDYFGFGVNPGGLGIGAGATQNGGLGQIFTLNSPGQLTSISFAVVAAYAGQPISASIFPVTGGVPGTTALASTAVHTITQVEQDSGAWITMKLTTGNLSLPAGDFLVAVNELGDSTAGVGTTPFIYTPNKIFVRWTAGTNGVWTDVGSFGANFERAFMIRPNFACVSSNFAASATSTVNGCNASATALPTNGTAPYTYMWSTGATTSSISNVTAGTYTVTIKDAGNCYTTASTTITIANAPTATVTAQNALCAGGTGSATVAGSGGTAPYTYSWTTTPPQTTATISVSTAGTYTAYVTDATGCKASGSATVTIPSAINVAASGINPSCNGGATGSAIATASGGTAPYTYTWSNNQTGANATGLAAGTYTVTAHDANGCIKTATVTLTQPSAINVIASSTSSTGTNGSATAVVAGGTSPYTYSWSNGGTTSTIVGLAPGTYCVTVTDAGGCAGAPSCTTVANHVSIDPISVGITNMDIQPNPSNGLLTLNVSLANADAISVNIYDLTGKSVYTTTKSGAVQYTENIDIREAASGMYFVSITTSKGTTYQRIVKQ